MTRFRLFLTINKKTQRMIRFVYKILEKMKDILNKSRALNNKNKSSKTNN